MKHKSMAVTAAAFLSALLTPVCLAGNNKGGNKTDSLPTTPVAAFSVNPTVAQAGTLPTLSWSIAYPSRVGDVAMITPTGTLILTKQMYVSVRPVGTGVTGINHAASPYTPAEIRISVNGGSFKQLFYGTPDDVDPTSTLYTKLLNTNTSIDFGGRYVKDGSWTTFHSTRSSNMQMVSLVDGDQIPTSYDLNQSGNMAEYLKPYVDSTGKVDIGPLSILVMGEYATSNLSSPSYDYQDFVVLVTLSQKNNNGHGNNLDGIDSSNPGQGCGGPNGAEDPSGNVDDES